MPPWVTGTPGHDDRSRWGTAECLGSGTAGCQLTPKPSAAPFLLCSQAAPSTPRTQCAIKYNRDVDRRANLITATSREHRGSVVATVAIKETQLLTVNVSNAPGVCAFRWTVFNFACRTGLNKVGEPRKIHNTAICPLQLFSLISTITLQGKKGKELTCDAF